MKWNYLVFCAERVVVNAKIGRELVKSFLNVFVRLLLIWSSSVDLALGQKYFDIVSPKSIWNVHLFSKYLFRKFCN